MLLNYASELDDARIELSRFHRQGFIHEIYMLVQKVRGPAIDLGLHEVGRCSTELYVWLREHSYEDCPEHRTLRDQVGAFDRLVSELQACLATYSRKIQMFLGGGVF